MKNIYGFQILFFEITYKKRGEPKEPTKWFGALCRWLAAMLVLNHIVFLSGFKYAEPNSKMGLSTPLDPARTFLNLMYVHISSFGFVSFVRLCTCMCIV